MKNENPTFKYFYSGSFDNNVFIEEYEKEFSKNPKYRKSIQTELEKYINFIANDQGITDIRWAAYMLATVQWETTNLVKEEVKDKKGRTKIVKRWVHTMAPVEEVGHGKGRKYYEPVKVKPLNDGSVRITEHDGDQFIIKTDGRIVRLLVNGKESAKFRSHVGAQSGGEVSQVYTNDDGTEHEYYGRGYVQLTWWSNYAKASLAIGKGFDLLLNPELVMQPEIAYELMSHGMRTGQGFANGRSFKKFFIGGHTDYEGARSMVNGIDCKKEIAEIARKFESILLKSKIITPSSSMRLP